MPTAKRPSYALVFGAAIIALASAGSAAQVPTFPNACARCGVFSFVDSPEAEATVMRRDLVFKGWGFECEGGGRVDRVDLSYQDYSGYWRPLVQDHWTLASGLHRPDVAGAFRAVCPNVTEYAGWHLYVTNPPPAGLRRVALNIWVGPYFQPPFFARPAGYDAASSPSARFTYLILE